MALKRVLIVEDSMDIGRYYQETIRAAFGGVPITLVPSAEEALLEASRYSYDLLITDIRLPGISGFDLARKIRPRQPEIKIMMVTGLKVDSFLEKQTRDLNIDLLLSKPVGIVEFLEGVEKLTGEHSALATGEAPASAKVKPGKSGPLARSVVDEPRTQRLPYADSSSTGKTVPLPRRVGQEAQTLGALLVELRSALNAQAVIVIDAQGSVVDQAGEWPGQDLAALLVPDVLAALAASAKVSAHLRPGAPSAAHALHGETYDLAFSAVGGAAALVFLRASSGALRLALAFEHLLTLQERIASLLEAKKKAPPLAVPAIEPPPETVSQVILLPQTVDPVLDHSTSVTMPLNPGAVDTPLSEDGDRLDELSAIFGSADPAPAAQDADAFWDQAVSSKPSSAPVDGALTYDQAREMGLLPDDQAEAKKLD